MNPGRIISICKRAGLSGPTVDSDVLRSLEVGVNGRLPLQYRLLHQKIGAIQFGHVFFYHPKHVLAYAAGIWNMSEASSNFWAAVPIARYGESGDDIGFLRDNGSFSDKVFLLDHEKEWYADRNTGWAELCGDDLASFIETETTRRT
jgi:hypothetical protein